MRSTLLFAVVTSLVWACAHEAPRPAVTGSAGEDNPSPVGASLPTNATVAAPRPWDQVVNLGPNLRRACAIDDVDAAPKFDFDEAKLSSNDKNVLTRVATCLTTGPLKGRAISLVGRADPRGESEYNMNLGGERASAAKAYIQLLGVDPSRLHDTSRGALDADGRDEDGWRVDRRVDLEVAE